MFFSWSHQRAWDFERKTTKSAILITSNQELSTWLVTVHVDRHRLAESRLSGFSPVELHFPHFHTVLFGRKLLCTPKEWAVMLPSLRRRWARKLFGILLRRRFVSSPPLACSSVHLFISLWTHTCLFPTWIIIYYSTICHLARIVPALATGSSFCWLLCPLDRSPLVDILSTSLFPGLQDAPGSQPRKKSLLQGARVPWLETKVWVLVMLTAHELGNVRV